MKIRLISIFFILSLIFSCKEKDASHGWQGTISYDVTYISNRTNMPTNLLPRKIILRFKGNKNITTIEGFMGMFALSNISDFSKNRNITLLKVMDKKLYYIGERNEFPFFFDNMSDIKIDFTNDTLTIAGFNCKKAIIYFTDENKSFELFYTTDIPIEEPNRLTPYKDIEGVLMAFNIDLNKIEMRVTATQFKPQQINDDIFEIPENYIKISKKKMSSIINKLLE